VNPPIDFLIADFFVQVVNAIKVEENNCSRSSRHDVAKLKERRSCPDPVTCVPTQIFDSPFKFVDPSEKALNIFHDILHPLWN
jgi:hypothetical protein